MWHSKSIISITPVTLVWYLNCCQGGRPGVTTDIESEWPGRALMTQMAATAHGGGRVWRKCVPCKISTYMIAGRL